MLVNYGPLHPSVHGALRLILDLDGEKINSITPDIGYMHRGIEKLVEDKKYMQIIPFMDRLDYISPVCQEYSYVLACEKIADITVPRKAQFIRILLAELTRIAHHLLHFNMLTYDTGALSPFVWAMEEREKIMWIFERISGARVHMNYFVIGGVSADIDNIIIDDIGDFIKNLKKLISDIEKVMDNRIFYARTKGVGVISRELAVDIGASGPTLRASGLAWDLRRKQPYDCYNELEFLIPVGSFGDCYDRYLIKIYEIYESIKIIEQCCRILPGLEYIKAKPIFRLPPGHCYVSTEAPKGEFGVLLYSVGDNGSEKPYRLHIRSAGFSVLQKLEKFVDNIADLPVVLASLDIVLGDVDR